MRVLAGRLHQDGFKVFLDQWEIGPGDVLVHRLEEGIRDSANGVLVFSPASVAKPWVREEYAAMLTRAVDGKQRFIPVLHGEAELPPFAASRLWVDFRGAAGEEWERRFAELARALRGERLRPPDRDGPLLPPPGGVRPEGPHRVTLRISADEVSFVADDGSVVSHAPKGIGHSLEDQLWRLAEARRRGPGVNGLTTRAAEADTGLTGLEAQLLAVGQGLGAAFLDGSAGQALAEAVAAAEQTHAAIRLGIQVDDDALADLPWETLTLPGRADSLALHPHVEYFRDLPTGAATPGMNIKVPLRILVVLASPDGPGSGPLLDLEKELAQILKAVEPARRYAAAYVRILNQGTLAAIEEALKQQRFHVLHISCHAAPGALLLENEKGGRHRVSAQDLAGAIPKDRGVPLIVLSGCSTALADRTNSMEEGEAALPGLARGLAAKGLPAVLAMTAPVTDPYATALAGRLYYELAISDRPEVLTALSEARRDFEAERRRAPAGSLHALLVEWATPALFLRGPSLPLYAVTDGVDDVKAPAPPRLAPGVVVRAVGEFVGRRAEIRSILSSLRGQVPGVLLHGIGGVGKSSLAAELITQLGQEAGLVISTAGRTSPDELLTTIADHILRATATAGPEAQPLRQLAISIRDPQHEWRVRLDALGQHLLDQLPVILLLDNFEDNLAAAEGGRFAVTDKELAAFLAAWLRVPGRSRLLVTSRHPFPLPDDVDRLLDPHHLGPLSPAETRKLLWRLPALDALTPDEQRRALTDVGGHPRTLEYLDALLRAGQSRFPDIAKRMEGILARRGITRPQDWYDEVGGDLDRALAESITLAVDDTLLGDLLGLLDESARQVLVGVSVYRIAVDRVGVAWPVSPVVEPAPDPDRDARLERVSELLAEARRTNPQASVADLGLPSAELDRLQADREVLRVPPLAIPDGLESALGGLARLGLVSPVPHTEDTADRDRAGGAEGAGRWMVHRWTAATVARPDLTDPQQLRSAHTAAAVYWQWRVRVWPQSRDRDIADLLEARHHHHTAGDLDAALGLTDEVCGQLHTWGAWGREEQLHRETMTWLTPGTREAAVALHQLGIIAQERGDYDQALDYYRQSLAIEEELGNRAGIATTYLQLGTISKDMGDYDQALDYYQQSLTIFEELSDRAGAALVHHGLGMIAQYRGDYDQALDYYRQSVTTLEELGDRASAARVHHQLGMIAQYRGDFDQALDYYRQSLAIKEELGNRAGTASSYHQLGIIAQERGDFDQALDYYRRSLAIEEELGDRAGTANSYHQLGNIAQDRGDFDQALDYYRQSLTINEELGNRAGTATTISQIGVLFTATGRVREAVGYTLRGLSIRLQLGSPDINNNLHWLTQQRQSLGHEEFGRVLTEHLDTESISNLTHMIDTYEAESR